MNVKDRSIVACFFSAETTDASEKSKRIAVFISGMVLVYM